MKKLHLHISVPEMGPAINFYSTLLNAAPAVVKGDYAKWLLDDPSVNLAISTRARAPGINHVGIQVDSSDELVELASRLESAGADTFDQDATTCCYARSDKSWVVDPAGVRWETFYTHGESTTYGEDEILPEALGAGRARAMESARASCC